MPSHTSLPFTTRPTNGRRRVGARPAALGKATPEVVDDYGTPLVFHCLQLAFCQVWRLTFRTEPTAGVAPRSDGLVHRSCSSPTQERPLVPTRGSEARVRSCANSDVQRSPARKRTSDARCSAALRSQASKQSQKHAITPTEDTGPGRLRLQRRQPPGCWKTRTLVLGPLDLRHPKNSATASG